MGAIARGLAEVLQRRRQDEQRQREAVIAEFAGDPHAMAVEILRHRHGPAQVAKAISWMKLSAPIILPGSTTYFRRQSGLLLGFCAPSAVREIAYSSSNSSSITGLDGPL
jgi:hypothetical protein